MRQPGVCALKLALFLSLQTMLIYTALFVACGANNSGIGSSPQTTTACPTVAATNEGDGPDTRQVSGRFDDACLHSIFGDETGLPRLDSNWTRQWVTFSVAHPTELRITYASASDQSSFVLEIVPHGAGHPYGERSYFSPRGRQIYVTENDRIGLIGAWALDDNQYAMFVKPNTDDPDAIMATVADSID